MAKTSGTRTPPPRKAANAKAAKPVAKASAARTKTAAAKPAAGKSPAGKSGAKPASKPAVKVTASKSGAASKAIAKKPAAPAKLGQSTAAKPLQKTVAKPVVKAGTKLTKPTIAAAKPAKPVARTAKTVAVGKGDTSADVSASPRPAKLATPSDRPVPKGANGSVAPATLPSSAPIEKAAGRIMLTQGPIAARPLTKKGTFAPIKPGQTNGTLKPLPKPVRRREEPLEQPFIPVRPQPPVVRTSEKAQKNKAGLSPKELDFFRDLVLAKRRELVGDMSSMEREALRENGSDLSTLPIHMADQGTDAYEQEFTLHLVEKDRGLLRELNDALAKIQNGTYGLCEGTGLAISKPRLEAQPWARHSIEFARQLEKRKMPFRR